MVTRIARAGSWIGVDAVGVAGSGVEAAGLGSVEATVFGVGAAILLPTIGKIWTQVRSAVARDPELADTPTEKVESVFDVLANSRYRAANDALDDALDDLINEPDWTEVRKRLDCELTEWARKRPEGAANPPDHDVMVRVILSCIQNLREATYRTLFAEHYREVISVDPAERSEVEKVFARLQAEPRRNVGPREDNTPSEAQR